MSFRNYKEISVGELRKFSANSRTHSEEQIGQIVRSIEEFGFTNPLLVDDQNNIIAGHGRLLAASYLKLESLPCIVLEGLTDAQKAALVIADNKIALNAGWDTEILSQQLGFLEEQGFDLSLTGFSSDELLELMPCDFNEGFADENSIPETNEETITVLGDVWLLGNHRLVCGDSTLLSDVTKLLAGQSPNTMITDPPYGVNYEAGWRAGAKGVKKTAREENSSLKNDDNADWTEAYKLFQGQVSYVWHASLFSDVVMKGLRGSGFQVKQEIIWNKNVHALSSSDYHWKHENCWYALRDGKGRNWKGGRKQMTVWDIPSIAFEKEKTSHPTQKPVELFLRSILHHTNEGEYVYDPFAGSGTLMVACEKSKRRALMMELDPKYCDVIVKRYEEYTGQKAIREGENA